MSSVYFMLIPLSVYVLYKKIVAIIDSVKTANHSKLKADLFFLTLVIIVITNVVMVII